MAKVLVVLALAALLAPASAAALPPGFTETTPWTIPDYATAVRFAPDGHVFAAGKGGMIYDFAGPDDRTPTVFADLRREVFDGWDRGLIGLAIDPDYADGRPYLYVAYTYDKRRDSADSALERHLPDPPDFDRGLPRQRPRLAAGPDGSETVLVEASATSRPATRWARWNSGPTGRCTSARGDGASYNSADYGGTGDPPNPCGDPPGGAGTALTPPTALGGALRAQSYRRPTPAVSLDGTILRIDPDTGAAFAATRAVPTTCAGGSSPTGSATRSGSRSGRAPASCGSATSASATWEEIDRSRTCPRCATTAGRATRATRSRTPTRRWDWTPARRCRRPPPSSRSTRTPTVTRSHGCPGVNGSSSSPA